MHHRDHNKLLSKGRRNDCRLTPLLFLKAGVAPLVSQVERESRGSIQHLLPSIVVCFTRAVLWFYATGTTRKFVEPTHWEYYCDRSGERPTKTSTWILSRMRQPAALLICRTNLVAVLPGNSIGYNSI